MGTTKLRQRHDGWTPARQAAFLQALRETACVREACTVVGLSSTSAYRTRGRVPEFAEAWDHALKLQLSVLERSAFTRAVEGWLEPIVHAGKIVGHRRRYSDAMLRLLLQREDARVAYMANKGARRATAAETNAALRKLLDELAAKERAKEERARAAMGTTVAHEPYEQQLPAPLLQHAEQSDEHDRRDDSEASGGEWTQAAADEPAARGWRMITLPGRDY